MSSFQDLGFFVHNNPEAEAKSSNAYAPEREPVLCRIHVTHLGFCLSVIKNENWLNLENTTSSVLSVIVN